MQLSINRRFLFPGFLAFAWLPLLFLIGCGASGPAPIDPKAEWLNYFDQRSGFGIKYPATYTLVPKGNGELWVRGPDKKVAYRTCFVDYETAKERGLWVKTEPLGTVYVAGGRIAHHYVYDHWDGPTYSRTAAYVLEHRDKMLALEIRLDKGNENGMLDEGQETVLRSFTLDQLDEEKRKWGE